MGKHPREYLDFTVEDGETRFEELLIEPDAAAAFLWVSLHRDDPAVTFDSVVERFTTAELVDLVVQAAKALGWNPEEQQEAAPEVATPVRPPKARAGAK